MIFQVFVTRDGIQRGQDGLLRDRLRLARQQDAGVDKVTDGLCDLCLVHVILFLQRCQDQTACV